MSKTTVTLKEIKDELKLKYLYEPKGADKILVTSTDVCRPGLQLAAGFFDYFDSSRLLIFGSMELAYLEDMMPSERSVALERLFAYKVPAAFVTRGMDIYPEMMDAATLHGIPVLVTDENTSHFMAAVIAYLNLQLAPSITRHGVLVEVYGEGVLLLGESGVGKSETAMELVKRGHRLVADDAVEIRRVSAKTLLGSAPDIIRHFIELRGIGIIDVKNIFGMGAVKDMENIDLIIHMEGWQEGKPYERLGLNNEYTNMLGVDVPSIVIPVKPGRNLAIIVEVAAMNARQNQMGYNAAEALTNKQMLMFSQKSD